MACHTEGSYVSEVGTEEHSLEANEADAVSDKTGDRSGDRASGGVEASVLHSRVCFLPQRNKPRVLPCYRCALMKELSACLGLPLEEITARSSVTMGLRNTKELRNTILLLIPFEETNSIKWFFKSRSLFVVQISLFFF